ncbi:hypothetical protein B296_00041265 [Ensete ventricosum]|uniref:Uncharacterized protein n=1 Tax=Ensete ventricosum TaxID=4639 RepID=A0A426ZMD0_ENSVE|nr:hypothetical protein B296_00041265 [Ensete ventricosum]
MDRLYKVTEVRGEPMIACFKCQMREAAEVVEMRSPMMPMGRWREDEAGSARSRHNREQVNYNDVPGAGGYHWFCDPFSVAHAAICVEEDDDVAGL